MQKSHAKLPKITVNGDLHDDFEYMPEDRRFCDSRVVVKGNITYTMPLIFNNCELKVKGEQPSKALSGLKSIFSRRKSPLSDKRGLMSGSTASLDSVASAMPEADLPLRAEGRAN